MENSDLALAKFERDLNVINPEDKTNILSSRLLQLNTEFTNAQADRVRKEAAFKSLQSGTVAAAEVSGQGDELNRLQDRVNQAKQHLASGGCDLWARAPGVSQGVKRSDGSAEAV